MNYLVGIKYVEPNEIPIKIRMTQDKTHFEVFVDKIVKELFQPPTF